MNRIETIIELAKKNRRRIVMSEGEDLRVIEASIKAYDTNLITPILIGDIGVVRQSIRTFGANPDKFLIVDPNKTPNLKRYAEEFSKLRRKGAISFEQSIKYVARPFNFAPMMVRLNDADGAIGGAVETTSKTVTAALKIIGKEDDTLCVSSFFLIVLDKSFHSKNGILIFSDAGLIIEPNEHELIEIAKNSIKSYRKLLKGEPKVAMLSFSTHGSAKHKKVRLVSNATRKLKDSFPNIKIDGEIQFDAAFVPEICQRKAPNSPLNGDANIMIFPNLDAANLSYKIAERLGRASAIGPILQGLAKPANDLSRGCSVEDIYRLMAVTALQVK